MIRKTPISWTKPFKVYKRITRENRYGGAESEYKDEPDLDIEAGSENAISWQPISTESIITQYGEKVNEMLEGVDKNSLEINEHDRIKVNNIMYEVVAVQLWNNYRNIVVKRVM